MLDPAHGDGQVRSAVLAQYSLQDLHNAIVKVRELAQPPKAPHADELKAHYASLRRILTPLLQTITFDATPAGHHVIDALKFLVRLDQPQPPKLHHAPTDVVTGRWKPLVLDSNQVVDRPFYTLCVLEQLQAHLDRRDVFVPAADRWGDPRAKLMAPALWATERGRLTAAINHLTAQGEVIRDEDKARLAPFGHRHLNLIGRYLYVVPAAIHQGALRPFRDPSDADDPLFDLEDLDGL